MNYTTKQYIDEQVKLAVRNELTPGFFDVFFQELRFKNATDNAVSRILPTELQRQLSANNSIVSSHVQSQLPGALQPYVSTHIDILKQQFRNMIEQQDASFNATQKKHLSELEKSSTGLIKSKIAEISGTSSVIQQLRTQLAQEQLQSIKDSQEKINRLEKQVNSLANFGIFSCVLSVASIGFALISNELAR